MKIYGAITKEDYLDGGRYSILEKLDKGIVFFDGSDRVYAMDLGASHLDKTDLEGIKKSLGAPADKGVSDVDGDYYLEYGTGDVTVIFNAKDKTSAAEKVRIINKNMMSDAPQKII